MFPKIVISEKLRIVFKKLIILDANAKFPISYSPEPSINILISTPQELILAYLAYTLFI